MSGHFRQNARERHFLGDVGEQKEQALRGESMGAIVFRETGTFRGKAAPMPEALEALRRARVREITLFHILTALLDYKGRVEVAVPLDADLSGMSLGGYSLELCFFDKGSIEGYEFELLLNPSNSGPINEKLYLACYRLLRKELQANAKMHQLAEQRRVCQALNDSIQEISDKLMVFKDMIELMSVVMDNKLMSTQ